jgi:hypothetical protein
MVRVSQTTDATPSSGSKAKRRGIRKNQIKTIWPADSGQPLSTSFSINNFYLPVAYKKQYRTFSGSAETVKPKLFALGTA